ncbi:MAG: hypothetical protein ABJL99_13555 [Aliishimia sp.]
MPILILILSAIGGAIWWWAKQNPRDAIDTAQDVVTTIRNAPRRLAFRQQTKGHPVEGIDDSRIAVGAIAQAFLELDGLPTQEQRQTLFAALRTKLRCTEEEAREIETLGRWLIDQCNGPSQAISRLARRLYKIDGDSSWEVLQDILSSLVTGELPQSQIDEIDDIRLALRK